MSSAPRSLRVSWLVLVISVVAVLGHVCALPAHAHAGGTPAVHHDMDSAAPHDGGEPDEGLHAASCHAVTIAAPTIAGATVIVGRVAPEQDRRAIARSSVESMTVARTPPLFLLHVVLLI